MAILDNNLTNEEKEANFTESEIDNDVFYIEQLDGKYPGDIPDYDSPTFLNTETENRTDFENVTEIDSPNSEIIRQEDKILPESINNDTNVEPIKDIVKSEINNNLQFNDEYKAEFETDKNINENTDNIEDLEKIDHEQSIVFDNDFLNLLKDDVAKHTEKIESIEKQKQDDGIIQFGTSIEVDTTQGKEEFIADLLSMEMETKIRNNTEEIADDSSDIINDFNIIDANTNADEINNKTNEIQNNTDNINTDNKTKEKYMTEEEKQKKKKTFALIVAIVSVAMILLIGGIVGYLYLSNKQNIPTEPKNIEQQDAIKQDTTTVVIEEVTEEDSIITDATTDTTIIDTPKVITEPPKPKTESKPPTQKSVTKTTTVANVPKNEPTSAKTTEQGSLYTIQVYSSPMKSDAEKRLTLLNQKGITGYITEQNIKGEIWYRVRFGSFEKYEDAKNTIQRYGIKDVWIERIR